MISGARVTFLSAGLQILERACVLQLQGSAMDMWDFKKWRRQLRYSQVEAGKELGLSRGAVQKWETDANPVPVAIELACRELLRRWRRRPEFGPVTLIYADFDAYPIPPERPPVARSTLMQAERHSNNESALSRAALLRDSMTVLVAYIVEDDGKVIWSGPALSREMDARKSGGSRLSPGGDPRASLGRPTRRRAR
jgi:DNA-binding XRE family transcriptional regulator